MFAPWHGTAQHSTAQHSTAQHSTAQQYEPHSGKPTTDRKCQIQCLGMTDEAACADAGESHGAESTQAELGVPTESTQNDTEELIEAHEAVAEDSELILQPNEGKFAPPVQ